MNSLIEMDEHIRHLKVRGFTSHIDDMEFIRVAYNNTDSIPVAEIIGKWLQFGADLTTSAKNETINQAMRTVSHEEL